MPKKRKTHQPSKIDIFQILSETTKKEKMKLRAELLAPLGVKELFAEGDITINKKTCDGVECKLCIEACPTSALFWKVGEVEVTRQLCIYCGACVLNCIVDHCIKIVRKRTTGEVEKFSTPREFTMLQHGINAGRRHNRITDIFPTTANYLKRYGRKRRRD